MTDGQQIPDPSVTEVSDYLGTLVEGLRYEDVFLLIIRKMKEIEAKVDSNG